MLYSDNYLYLFSVEYTTLDFTYSVFNILDNSTATDFTRYSLPGFPMQSSAYFISADVHFYVSGKRPSDGAMTLVKLER